MTTHDIEFEACLLKLIDDLLKSSPTFEDFVMFSLSFAAYFGERRTSEMRGAGVESTHHSMDELFQRLFTEGARLKRASEIQMTAERLEFFEWVAERAAFTVPTVPDADARRYGWGSLPEFLASVQARRGDYSARFEM